MDRKMRELLALRQGSDTVYRYAQKFNSLCQYGGHHVDTVGVLDRQPTKGSTRGR
jgi:hypothetical protein